MSSTINISFERSSEVRILVTRPESERILQVGLPFEKVWELGDCARREGPKLESTE